MLQLTLSDTNYYAEQLIFSFLNRNFHNKLGNTFYLGLRTKDAKKPVISVKSIKKIRFLHTLVVTEMNKMAAKCYKSMTPIKYTQY